MGLFGRKQQPEQPTKDPKYEAWILEIEQERLDRMAGVDTTDTPTQALHYSAGKPGVDQIPPEVLMELGQVFSYGEAKYSRDNWKAGTDWHQMYGSLLRHAFKFWGGEDIDPESGLPHLAHVMWNAQAIRYWQLHGKGRDDRDVFSMESSRYADALAGRMPPSYPPQDPDPQHENEVRPGTPIDTEFEDAPKVEREATLDHPTLEDERGNVELAALTHSIEDVGVPAWGCWCDMYPERPHAPHFLGLNFEDPDQEVDENNDLKRTLYVYLADGTIQWVR